METLKTAAIFAGLLLGVASVWTLGYLKGRWDAGRSIARRYIVTPRDF